MKTHCEYVPVYTVRIHTANVCILAGGMFPLARNIKSRMFAERRKCTKIFSSSPVHVFSLPFENTVNVVVTFMLALAFFLILGRFVCLQRTENRSLAMRMV